MSSGFELMRTDVSWTCCSKAEMNPKLTRYVPSISILSRSSFSHHITTILWTFCIDLLPTICQTSQMFSMRFIAYLKEPTGGWWVFLGTFWEGILTLNPWAQWLFFPRAALSWREQRCRDPLSAFSGFSRSVKLLLPWPNTAQTESVDLVPGSLETLEVVTWFLLRSAIFTCFRCWSCWRLNPEPCFR